MSAPTPPGGLAAFPGTMVDRLTQRWVRWTGREVALSDHRWLDGPIGDPDVIGERFFERYTRDRGLRCVAGAPAGLMPAFAALAGPGVDPGAVAPGVADFYEQTSAFDLDVWAEWTGPFRPFGRALAVIFSRRLQQLNLPLSSLDTSRGMSSDVVPVVDATTGRHVFTAWVRRLLGTGHVIYVGAYSTCTVPDEARTCVRVVFPLPRGNAIVIMRPSIGADGSLTLISAGRAFGSPGFYFTVHSPHGRVWAKYVRAMRESIRVYEDGDEVRAEHVLTLSGLTFLRLHYRLRRRLVAAAGGRVADRRAFMAFESPAKRTT